MNENEMNLKEEQKIGEGCAEISSTPTEPAAEKAAFEDTSAPVETMNTPVAVEQPAPDASVVDISKQEDSPEESAQGVVENAHIETEQEKPVVEEGGEEISSTPTEPIAEKTEDVATNAPIPPVKEAQEKAPLQQEEQDVVVANTTEEKAVAKQAEEKVTPPMAPPQEQTFANTFQKALFAAKYFAELPIEKDFFKELKVFQREYSAFAGFKQEEFTPVLSSFGVIKEQQKANVVFAGLLFYLLYGKYPQACWEEAKLGVSQTAAWKINEKAKELISICSEVRGLKTEAVEEVVRKCRLQVESMDIGAFSIQGDVVGEAKLLEMFWEVFLTKYGNYKPSLWFKKMQEFANKEPKIRENCEYRENREGVEIYAVSYEGKLDKPLHVECEDCCRVHFYDEKTWLAVSADGVGSCVHSSLGSLVATDVLVQTIEDFLRINALLSDNKNESWARLMYYLRFELAKQFYKEWEDTVQSKPVFQTQQNASISQFTSTVQFAFGCEAFIACGRLGDGSFYVRKKEKKEGETAFGGMMLNDGISGVTQVSVHTMVHLKNNPTALQVAFFTPEEVTDILISSDGVTSAIGESVADADAFMKEWEKEPFEKRCETLSAIARRCAEYNVTQKGSGDDSTLIHVKIKE